mmetsp:Transcript_22563/g.36357  ORF Transcript_22563/g.36357 Transcript_22563/m.36357 type:complete len:369 (+) Transcript_22563:172-1278(+)
MAQKKKHFIPNGKANGANFKPKVVSRSHDESINTKEARLSRLRAKYDSFLSSPHLDKTANSSVSVSVNGNSPNELASINNERSTDLDLDPLHFLSSSSRAMLESGLDYSSHITSRTQPLTDHPSRDTSVFSSPRSRVILPPPRRTNLDSNISSHQHHHHLKIPRPAHFQSLSTHLPREKPVKRSNRFASNHLRAPSPYLTHTNDTSSDEMSKRSARTLQRDSLRHSSRPTSFIRRSYSASVFPTKGVGRDFQERKALDITSNADLGQLLRKLQEKVDRMERTLSRAQTPTSESRYSDEITENKTPDRKKQHDVKETEVPHDDDPRDLPAWVFVFLLFLVSIFLYSAGQPVFLVANTAFIFILSLKYLI